LISSEQEKIEEESYYKVEGNPKNIHEAIGLVRNLNKYIADSKYAYTSEEIDKMRQLMFDTSMALIAYVHKAVEDERKQNENTVLGMMQRR
jgi:hypothetical protein